MFPPFLNKGSKDVVPAGPVRFLQRFLIANGHAGEKLIADGDYGDKTADAVRRLQRRMVGIKPDGNFGPKTRAACAEIFGIHVDKIPMEDDLQSGFVVRYKVPKRRGLVDHLPNAHK